MLAVLKAPLVGVALAALLTTAACSSGGGDTASGDGKPVEGKTFSMALAVDPGNLDPTTSTSSAAREIFGVVYDTLVYAQDDGTIVDGLAKSWKSTPSSVTFTLKDGITCSDGSPLKAKDVADNVSYIADPKNGSELLGVVIQAGTTASADDAKNTVTVTTPKPDGLLVSELSGLFIMCRSGLDDHKSVAKAAAGTGPYTLKEAVSGDHYTFAPRKDYTWGPKGQRMTGKGVPTGINIRIIDNQTTIANLLRSGELNYATVSGTDAKRLPKNFKTLDLLSPAGEVWFNENKGHPGADPAVREALVTGVDRKALTNVATGKTGGPAKGLVTLAPSPCLSTDTVGPNLPAYDADKANQILDDAGWAKGSDGVREKDGKKLELKLTYTPTGLATRVAGMELLVTQWKALGAKVKLLSQPDAQLSEDLFSIGSWDATATPFSFNLPSQLTGFVSGPPSPKGANFANIQNEGYTKAVAKAIPLVGKKGCPAWDEAESALVKAHNPAPFFAMPTKTYYTKSTVTAPGQQIWGSSIRMLDK
jgi:peptide/nickel transport system substrate-binding protein